MKKQNGSLLVSLLLSALFLTNAILMVPAEASNNSEMSFEDKLVVLPWVTYAPSRSARANETEVRKDLQLLYDTGFLGIITYSSFEPLASVPRIAKEIGFQGVIMGIWSPMRREEIENAKNVSEYVDGYCVGNEGYSVRHEYDLATLEEIMEEIRGNTSKPVTTTEPVGRYLNDVPLLELGDWVFPNVHPYWYDRKYPKSAVIWTVQQCNELKSVLLQTSKPDKPVLFKEVGLPSAGDPACSETNQAEYFRLLQETTVPFAFFEAFDQPLKHEYWPDTDYDVGPHWGLFESNRSPKEVVKYLGRGTCFPSDGKGNAKDTFALREKVYVKGYGFPINTEVDVYFIPDGTPFTPYNFTAKVNQTTDGLGNLPLTSVWASNETSHLDIWIDVGRNGIRDKFDVVNNETVNTYPINVIKSSSNLTVTILVITTPIILVILGLILITRRRKRTV